MKQVRRNIRAPRNDDRSLLFAVPGGDTEGSQGVDFCDSSRENRPLGRPKQSLFQGRSTWSNTNNIFLAPPVLLTIERPRLLQPFPNWNTN